jgi:hypothetical protein
MIDSKDLASIQARADERGCTKEAIKRFADRYRERCEFRANGGSPIGVVPRLQMALKLTREGKGKELSARGGRRIFDIELPADYWNREPFTIRILTNDGVTCILTVLPPEFRNDKFERVKKQFHRAEREETIEPEELEERIVLPPPVKVGLSLGDALRRAMGQ